MKDLSIPSNLEWRGLTLRRINRDDSADLLAHFSDPAVIQHLDVGPLSDVREVEAIIEWAEGLYEIQRGVRWCVRDASGDFVGTCGFNQIALGSRPHGEVAFDLAAKHQGRGIMKTLLPGLIGFAFDRARLRRVQAFIDPDNSRSAHVLERHGFQREGRLRDYGFWKNRYWDVDLYSLLATDPPPATR